ncbi:hypothetical protein K435DRAFT_903567 [Dendrothele bispora CBS 962.96]|uniref:Protein kinase domain-containing protein n=1 Tax=Dendrothele bispora (strain CBS 962.96) TaxID=1314807 RepID=A0A4S8KL09_DENBC|nr:hypothetical protein K435DRAFT_903567 [Dendrothele bispora CBS 962.96]
MHLASRVFALHRQLLWCLYGWRRVNMSLLLWLITKTGSFDHIYKSPLSCLKGPIPINIVKQVAESVLHGLVYLHTECGVIH